MKGESWSGSATGHCRSSIVEGYMQDANETKQSLALLAALGYLEHLSRGLSARQCSPEARQAAESLIQSINRAIESGPNLKPEEVTFTKALLEPIGAEERQRLFVNHWTLGLGSQDAPVVVMGTEHAFGIEDTETFALDNCASAILWLSNAGPDMVAHLTQNAAYKITTYRAYHRNPWDYSPKLPWNHTWSFVAHAVGKPLHDLGLHAYQIDRSASPSKQAADGRVGSSQRVAFLTDVHTQLRNTARVLLLHGKTTDAAGPEWLGVNAEVSQRFLGVPIDFQGREVRDDKGRAIKSWAHDGRTVLHTWALNGGAVDLAYCQRVARLVEFAL